MCSLSLLLRESRGRRKFLFARHSRNTHVNHFNTSSTNYIQLRVNCTHIEFVTTRVTYFSFARRKTETLNFFVLIRRNAKLRIFLSPHFLSEYYTRKKKLVFQKTRFYSIMHPPSPLQATFVAFQADSVLSTRESA